MITTEPPFPTIEQALAQPIGRHFWIARRDGIVECGDPESFYAGDRDFEHLTFDISNNKVLINLGVDGALKHVAFFRSTHRMDSGPGGWTGQDLTKSGPYSFGLRIAGRNIDLAAAAWPVRTGLLDGIFPLTEHTTEDLRISLIAYAPLSEDGTRRPRAAIYGILVANRSAGTISGDIVLPRLPEVGSMGEILSQRHVTMALADSQERAKPESVPFELGPGASCWVPVIMASPGDWATIEEIRRQDSLACLNSTWSYHRAMVGRLAMPDDPFVAEFIERALLLSAGSVILDPAEDVAGTNFGTYPPMSWINMRDAFYPFLPLSMTEPDLFRRGIHWFLEYSVRPRGDFFEGGVTHSLSNSLAPAMMAALYYSATADQEFFIRTEGLKNRIEKLLETVVATRQGDVWLFPSRFISDGLSLGDYHTGSNVCAWFAFAGFGRILDEVYGDRDGAARYRVIAERIREALQAHCVIEGPFGRQYIEGVNANGTIPVMVHDGEESDTTLMPFYGFASYDDPIYKNTTRFAVSERNVAYCPETRGIVWETYGENPPIQPTGPRISDATFPGFVTALANTTDIESFGGTDGFMTEIRRLTDHDGSNWWWPYKAGARRGEVSRNIIPKCGWSTGVLAALFISEFLGVRYDAPTRTLRFRPFNPSSNFSWAGARLGCASFGLACARSAERVEVTVENLNPFQITGEIEIPLPLNTRASAVLVGGQAVPAPNRTSEFLGRPTVVLHRMLGAGVSESIAVLLSAG